MSNWNLNEYLNDECFIINIELLILNIFIIKSSWKLALKQKSRCYEDYLVTNTNANVVWLSFINKINSFLALASCRSVFAETRTEIAFAFLSTLTKRITGLVEHNKRNLWTTCEKCQDFSPYNGYFVIIGIHLVT